MVTMSYQVKITICYVFKPPTDPKSKREIRSAVRDIVRTLCKFKIGDTDVMTMHRVPMHDRFLVMESDESWPFNNALDVIIPEWLSNQLTRFGERTKSMLPECTVHVRYLIQDRVYDPERV